MPQRRRTKPHKFHGTPRRPHPWEFTSAQGFCGCRKGVPRCRPVGGGNCVSHSFCGVLFTQCQFGCPIPWLFQVLGRPSQASPKAEGTSAGTGAQATHQDRGRHIPPRGVPYHPADFPKNRAPIAPLAWAPYYRSFCGAIRWAAGPPCAAHWQFCIFALPAPRVKHILLFWKRVKQKKKKL